MIKKISFKRAAREALTLVLMVAMVLALAGSGLAKPMEAYAAGTVERLEGENAVRTSFKVADALKKPLGVGKFDAIVLARSNNYPDALSGSSLAAEAKAPILMVNDSVLKDTIDYINNNINPQGTVYILGGNLAVSEGFETGYREELELNIVRLGGADRYETNLLILNEVDRLHIEKHGVPNKNILVCTGKSYADSLAAGSLGQPMLLASDMFTREQMRYMQERGESAFTIIGGTKALGKNIETDCNKFGTSTRVAGENRYDTAVQIAKKYYGASPEKVILVYGDNFPDGIAAGPLAHFMKAPILLTSGKSDVASAFNYQVGAGRPSVTIIGGSLVVSPKLAAANNLFNKGWNAFGNGYIYINNNGLVVTGKFQEGGYIVTPTSGGLISKETRAEIKRRQELSAYGTAIVIDISDQKLDYISGGEVKFTTPVVTGNKGNHDTPTGEYYVRGKSYDPKGKIPLTGTEDDGSPYTSYVTYWMPFIGGDYGIHDATWRTRFGGSIYMGNGSHGCVNVPKSNMATLFNMVPLWTKIIIKK